MSPDEAPGTIASGGNDGRPRSGASAGGLDDRGRSSLGSMMGGCSDEGGGLEGVPSPLIARITASSREDGDPPTGVGRERRVAAESFTTASSRATRSEAGNGEGAGREGVARSFSPPGARERPVTAARRRS